MILALLLLAAVVFIIIVVGINDSMKKENKRLVEKNAALDEGLVAGRAWVAKLAKLQPMEAALAIHEQNEYNHKRNTEKSQ
ncbi:MAG: hypothetical protein IMF04_00395 [Proteobacteria bacterium]|nr:hypothetical protein [Pseudomonadota bacterium]